MRFLTTCLLLFCFQSFVVCTMEDGSITLAQRINEPESAKQTTVIAKNTTTETASESTFEFADIVHHLTKPLLVAIVVATIIHFSLTIQLNTIKNFSAYTNHSYHFIFRFLYPKHAFW